MGISEFAKNILGYRKIHLSSTEAISFPTYQTNAVGASLPLPTQFNINMPSVNTPPNTGSLGAIAVFSGGTINISSYVDTGVYGSSEEYTRITPVVNIEVEGWSNQNYYRPTKEGNTGMTATFDAETDLRKCANMDYLNTTATDSVDIKGVPQSIFLKPLNNNRSWTTGISVGNPFSKSVKCSVYLQQGHDVDIAGNTEKNTSAYTTRDLVGLNQDFSNTSGAPENTTHYPVDSIASVDLYFDFLIYDMDRISSNQIETILI